MAHEKTKDLMTTMSYLVDLKAVDRECITPRQLLEKLKKQTESIYELMEKISESIKDQPINEDEPAFVDLKDMPWTLIEAKLGTALKAAAVEEYTEATQL